jgi:CHASE3 domain sensor protein
MTMTVLLAVILVTRLGTDETRINDQNVPFATSVDAAALAAKGMANDERGYLISGDRRYLGEADARIVQARRAFAAAAQAASTEDERRTVSQASDSFETWVVRLQDEFATFGKDRVAAVKSSLGETRELRKTYEIDLSTAQTLAASSLADGNASIVGSASASRNLLLGCLLAVLAAGLVIGWWMVRLVALPVQRLLTIISDLSPDALRATPAPLPTDDHRHLQPAEEDPPSPVLVARRDASFQLTRFLRSQEGERVLDENGFDFEYALVLALSEDSLGDVMARAAKHPRPAVIAVYLSDSDSTNVVEHFALLGLTRDTMRDAAESPLDGDATIGTLLQLIRKEPAHQMAVSEPAGQLWAVRLLEIADT